MIVLGCDLDGVLADYLSHRDALGLPDEAAAYQVIHQSPDFWRTMPVCPDAAEHLVRLRQVDRLYFLTKRYGVDCQCQTAGWLAQWIPQPAVLIVTRDGDKGRLANLLGLTHLVDDREQAFLHLSRRTQGFLVDRPWNQQADLPRRVQRVRSIGEVLTNLGVPVAPHLT